MKLEAQNYHAENLTTFARSLKIGKTLEQLLQLARQKVDYSHYAMENKDHVSVNDLVSIQHEGRIVALFNTLSIRSEWQQRHQCIMTDAEVATTCRSIFLSAEPEFQDKELEVLVFSA